MRRIAYGRGRASSTRAWALQRRVMDAPKFKLLTTQEFELLSIEERMEYLQKAMNDLREKLESTRKQTDRIKPSGHGPK